jgi:two-component system, sensor histidine kinase and response regulator
MTNRNIRKQKNVEEILNLTQISIDNAKDLIFWIDENANIVFVNKTVCEQLGYSKYEIPKLTVFDVDAIFQKEHWTGHWKEILDKGTVTVESRHKKRNGETFPVEIKTNCIKFGDKIYYCAIGRDITERKLAEESLRDSRRIIPYFN